MNCSVFIKNSETSKIRVKNMRSLLYCSTSFASSTFPTSSIFMSETREEITKTLKKNSISLLSFLSAASSLIPVVFLFLFTKRMILFSIFFSFPSRRVQRGVIKQAPFFFSPFLLWSAGGIFLGFFFERRRTSSILSGRPKLARRTF